MAIYCVTYSEEDDWGESKDRSKTRPPADARLEEARISGKFARLIRWQDHKSTEIARVNADNNQLSNLSSLEKLATDSDLDPKQDNKVPQSRIDRSPTGSSSDTASLNDRETRLKIVKLVLEIMAVAVTIIGGIVALIWKIKQ